MAEFTIKATAKYKDCKDPGWVVSSKNPDFSSQRYCDYGDAFEEFREFVSGFVEELISTGSPEVEFSDPIISVKTDNFSNTGARFTIHAGAEIVSITWIVRISHKINRTLSEFEVVEVSPKVQSVYDKIMETSCRTGIPPDTVLNIAQRELEAQKSEGST